MQTMLRRALAVAFLAALVALPASVGAQTVQVDSTPFIVHASPATQTVRTARPGEPLLVQSVTSLRSARLTAEAPTTSGYKKVKSFPAGTLLFGAYAPEGWVYCAVAESTARWWAGDEFACYEDVDDDGRFDRVRLSGEPFMGVPLFVFQLGEPKTLPAPAPFEPIPAAEGPRVEYVLKADVRRPRTRRDEPKRPAEAVALTAAIGLPGRHAPIGATGARAVLDGGQTATLDHEGGRIRILGVEPDDSIRYVVETAMPTRVDRVVMGVTTTTRYVPIYVPAG
jgi:hypothetical protein